MHFQRTSYGFWRRRLPWYGRPYWTAYLFRYPRCVLAGSIMSTARRENESLNESIILPQRKSW
jgi:hypothetical protein